MLGNAGNVLLAIRPSSKGEAVDDAVHWVAFDRASNDVQFSLGKLKVLDIVGYGDGEVIGM